jgi:hypothetical protein
MAKVIEKNSIKIGKESMVILPKMNKKEYQVAWRNFEKMLKKASRLWKIKKSSLEIIREERE